MIQRSFYCLLVVSLFLGMSHAWAEQASMSCSQIDRIVLTVNTTNGAAGVRVRVKPRESATVGKTFHISFTGQNAHGRANDIAQSLKNCEIVTFSLSERRYSQDSAIPVNIADITVLSR
ncbi:MAG: hypothetical protein HYY62_09475 [Deltaproteobacteria bacterium]|nr:hypothetical protein [Deltaproteobacteria bacterium]